MSGEATQLIADAADAPTDGSVPAASVAPMSPAVGPRRHRARRIAVAVGFVLVTISTAVVLIALALTRENPRWWTAVNPADPETVATAERVENGVTSALTQVRIANNAADGPESAATAAWQVFITTEQANAWLNVRLRRWLADQAEQGNLDFRWPEGVGQMQVSFQHGRIHLGAVITRPSPGGGPPRSQTLAAALRPEFGPDGSLWMTAERIEIGRLAVPADWVIGSGEKTAAKVADVSTELARQPQTERVLAAIRGERPVLSRPSIKLADGRRVRIVAIEPADDRLVFTCTTEQRDGGRP
jgi:hypothetical protein